MLQSLFAWAPARAIATERDGERVLNRIFETLGLWERPRAPERVEGVVERLGFDHHRAQSGSEWLLALEGSERVFRLLDAVELPRADHEALTLTRPGDRVAFEARCREPFEDERRSGAEPCSLRGFRNFNLEERFPSLRSMGAAK